jgi:hypothetical protein
MQVDIVSAPTLTVQGTVTANLSATDNAVLDASLVKQTNIETLITTLDGVQDNILTKLTAIDSDTNDIKTAVEILDNAISGSEMQVDIVAALPAGTNNIGIVTANLSATDNAVLDAIETTNNACQVLLGTIDADTNDIKTSVQLIDDVVKAEDSAHSSGDKGVMALAVHQTTASLLAANGDYSPLSVDVKQHLRSAQELQTFAFTLPSSGTIGASNMGETDVFQFYQKVKNFTVFVGSNNTSAFNAQYVLKGSTDGSAFFTLSSSLYSSTEFNDNDKMNYFTLTFNIKFLKVQVTNASSSSDTFLVSICA